MAATYWHRHPRGFANECSLFRAESDTEAQDLESEGYTRLTRREMSAHVRWLNDENDAWGSNRAFGRIVIKDVLTAPEYQACYR